MYWSQANPALQSGSTHRPLSIGVIVSEVQSRMSKAVRRFVQHLSRTIHLLGAGMHYAAEVAVMWIAINELEEKDVGIQVVPETGNHNRRQIASCCVRASCTTAFHPLLLLKYCRHMPAQLYPC